MLNKIVFSTLAFFILACSPLNSERSTPIQVGSDTNNLYSSIGREHEVSFRAFYRTEYKSLEEVEALSERSKNVITEYAIAPTMDFLFGPLTNRSWASPQRTVEVSADWTKAELVDGFVEVPYLYRAVWLIEARLANQGYLDVPVPLSRELVYSKRWKRCSDSDPAHQTRDFYWYFWDPMRPGCDQKLEENYRIVRVELGTQTPNTVETFPEYQNMIGDGKMSLTFGFGYVEDPKKFNPDSDSDLGATGYQEFLEGFRGKWGRTLNESEILQGEYKTSADLDLDPDLVIGHRFSGKLNGVDVVVNIVMAAGVDQMVIFAKSFAHDHDDMFSWFGHSRVGSGFDAEMVRRMLKNDPDYYSISPSYQVIYWGGCNSYSYYTLPFFAFKNTKTLDIISNGLPSLFAFNAYNAMATAEHFLNWRAKPSYQKLVDKLEARAQQWGVKVLVNVLGDEDNDGDNEEVP